MNRLTMRNSDGTVSQPTRTTVEAVFYRLAEYEDTGFTPEDFDKLCREMSDMRTSIGISTYEQLQEIVRDGRLVRLPCKVGDFAYFVLPIHGGYDGYDISEPHRISEVGTRGFWTAAYPSKPDVFTPDEDDFTPWDRLGKTAWLSLEEAVKAFENGEWEIPT